MKKILQSSVFLLVACVQILNQNHVMSQPLSGQKIVNNCAELQAYANDKRKITWSRETYFQGFENATFKYREERGSSDPKEHRDSYLCELGYITSISPLGKLVCYGHLALFDRPSYPRPKMSWGYSTNAQDFFRRDSSSDYCRYVN
jgi:hypothetical protein